jgi:Transposase/EAL domain
LSGAAAFNVHQETVAACLPIGLPGARPSKEVRTFGTMTRDLEALCGWLKAAGVAHVGMESAGVTWRPVYAVLEGHFDLIVGNARHIRNAPGRKSDGKDAEWIADLVRRGLIAKSFVPPAPLRDLRELLRRRRKLMESQAAERSRQDRSPRARYLDMCRHLDLPCVAEGIERQEQLDELRLGGCAGGQGALFAGAMPEANGRGVHQGSGQPSGLGEAPKID